MPLSFAPPSPEALPLHVVSEEGFDDWLGGQPDVARRWLMAAGFKAGLGKVALVPGEDGAPGFAVAGHGTEAARARGRFALARAQAALSAGSYRLANPDTRPDLDEACLGWLLSRYRFDRYKKSDGPGAALVAPDGVDAARIEAIAAGEALTRDLINTPASDMGPDALEQAARDLAGEFGAEIAVITGDDLLDAQLPDDPRRRPRLAARARG